MTVGSGVGWRRVGRGRAGAWRVRGALAAVCALAPGCGDSARVPFAPADPGRDQDGDGRALDGGSIGAPRADADGGGPGAADAGVSDRSDAATKAVGCDDGPELHVLFIGNSHTYTNDVPGLVRQLACDLGTKVVTRSATPGGVGFTEHAEDTATLEAIAADAWDFVVLQDQQQRPGFRLDDLDRDYVPALRVLTDAIETNRATTRRLLYMVWSRRDGDVASCDYYPILCTFEGNTGAIAEGYRLHAERTASELASVALAWAAVRADPKAPLPAEMLWNGDGSHAELPGSYLAAAVLTGHMFDATTEGLVFNAGLSDEIALYLRRAADRIVVADREDPRVNIAESVEIACNDTGVCNASADAAPVAFTLSPDRCTDIRAGRGTASARIHTRMSRRDDGVYATVPRVGWYEVAGGKIAKGAYRVHAHVDIDADGKLGEGDLDACKDFGVGGDEDLRFTTLVVR
jgi:hypothetical protein